METLDYIKPVDTSECNIVPQKSERYGIGSLIQISALGPQDAYLTEPDTEGNLEYNLFDMPYSTHYPLFPFHEEIPFVPKFGEHSIIHIPLKKTLFIRNIFLNVQLPSLNQSQYLSSYVHWKNNLGYKLIKNVKFMLNNEVITEYTGEILRIHSLLHNIKHFDNNLLTGSYESNNNIDGNSKELFILLPLFPEIFFPLCSLYNSDLVVYIEFEHLHNLIESDGDFENLNFKLSAKNKNVRISLNTSFHTPVLQNISHFQLLIDYYKIISEDEIENNIHSKSSYTFQTFEQQSFSIVGNSQTFDLQFNENIKQLVFTFVDSSGNLIKPTNIKLTLGSNETSFSQNSNYFSVIQQYYFNSNFTLDNIFCYSFSLHPSAIQPSGLVDFSKLSKKLIEIQGASGTTFTIFAFCYKNFETSNGLGITK
jgi:hypothetical protein